MCVWLRVFLFLLWTENKKSEESCVLNSIMNTTVKAPKMLKNGRNQVIRFPPPCSVWFASTWWFSSAGLSRSWLVIVKPPHLLLFSRSGWAARWQDFNWLITRKLTIRTSANTQNEQSPNCDAHTHTHTCSSSLLSTSGNSLWVLCDKSSKASFSCRSHQTHNHDISSRWSGSPGVWAFSVIYMCVWIYQIKPCYRVMNTSSH